MQIAVRSTQIQRDEFVQKGFDPAVTVQWLAEDEDLNSAQADAYFDLAFNDIDPYANKFLEKETVFVNAVACTCSTIDRKNYIRINAWNGFLNRPVIEVSGIDDDYARRAGNILDILGWKYIWVPDDYGLVSARIVSMIINEAYYALEENVSTKEQIDIAMKLGTNYPFGPFEWSEKIGLKNIYTLLKNLSGQNNRYIICKNLADTAMNKQ